MVGMPDDGDERRSRTGMGVFAVATVLALVGCDAPDGPRVATAQRPTVAASDVAATTSAPAKQSDYDKAVQYTRCMTAHGVPTADPMEGMPLVTTFLAYGIWTEEDMRASPETRKARFGAQQQCKHLLPATWPVKQDPKDIARDRPFFDCMQDHRIDPPASATNGMVNYPTDPMWQHTPEYEAAEAACRHLIDDPANNQPENGGDGDEEASHVGHRAAHHGRRLGADRLRHGPGPARGDGAESGGGRRV
jgi:hypothetical protein